MSQFERDVKSYGFTPSQEITVSEAIDFIAKPFDAKKFVLGINGAGGTGKTYITNYIIFHCRYTPSVIKCCSPTHKACRVFSQAIDYKEVNTIQSTFGFRLNTNIADFDPNKPEFKPIASPKLDDIKVLIIDEVSMLPIALVNYMFKICLNREIKVICIGDGSQLAPVNERKSTCFDKCYKVFTLKEVVRQGEGNPISKLLNILRSDIRNKTYKFLEFVSANVGNYEYNQDGKGWCVANPSQFKDYIDTAFQDEEYSKNIDLYRIIAYTNVAVADWNHYVRNKLIPDADKKIITRNDLIMCYESIVDDFLSMILCNSEEYIIHDIVDYVDNTYKFKGYLIKFQMVNGGIITKPLFIIDHRDRFSITMYYKVINELIRNAKNSTSANRNSRWKEYYTFKKTYLLAANIVDRSGKILLNRDLDYAFAITSHKSQGSTYNNVFVDVNDIVYDKRGTMYANQDDMLRRLYVACSRARNQLTLCFGK